MTTTLTERKIIGLNIRRLREEKEIGPTEAAQACDIDRTYWFDIENGTANVTFEKYERIAAFLEVSVRDLLEDPQTVFAQSEAPKQSKTKRRKAS